MIKFTKLVKFSFMSWLYGFIQPPYRVAMVKLYPQSAYTTRRSLAPVLALSATPDLGPQRTCPHQSSWRQGNFNCHSEFMASRIDCD